MNRQRPRSSFLSQPFLKSRTPPDRHFRLVASFAVGVTSGLLTFARLSSPLINPDGGASDFTWHWLAVRAVLAGANPYEAIETGGPYNLPAPYIYPITTTLAAFPFASWAPPVLAVSLFMAVSVSLMTWGITKDGFARFPMFLSLPFVWAVFAGQWAPLVIASMLLANLSWLAPVKPTIGLAAFAYRPKWSTIVGGAIFCAIGFLVNPNWLGEWYALRQDPSTSIYKAPIFVLGGPLLLLAVMRLKQPEARMLFILSLVPQLFLFYDQLLLWLIPRTWKGCALLSGLSWVAWAIGNWRLPRVPHADNEVSLVYAPVVVALLYLPTLVMVFQQSGSLNLRPRPAGGTVSS